MGKSVYFSGQLRSWFRFKIMHVSSKGCKRVYLRGLHKALADKEFKAIKVVINGVDTTNSVSYNREYLVFPEKLKQGRYNIELEVKFNDMDSVVYSEEPDEY